jgi:hypothetical protein
MLIGEWSLIFEGKKLRNLVLILREKGKVVRSYFLGEIYFFRR